MKLARYSGRLKTTWEKFLASTDGPFTYSRDFLTQDDKDTEDCSFFIEDEGSNVIGILPGGLRGDDWVSHPHTTFGGPIWSQTRGRMSSGPLLQDLEAYAKKLGLKRLEIRCGTDSYSGQPVDLLNYNLWLMEWRLAQMRPNFVMSDGPRGLGSSVYKRAVAKGLDFEFNANTIETFEFVRRTLLEEKGIATAHSSPSFKKLAERFPNNIWSSRAIDKNGEIVAAAIIFSYPKVQHTQYLASSDAGKKSFAMGGLIQSLYHHLGSEKALALGHSHDPVKNHLDEGLAEFKFRMGAKVQNYQIWEKDI